MAREPLVSVIIPTHNRKPKYLATAVDSVASQTYKNIELIIIDDSSEEISKDIETREWDSLTSAQYIRNREHDGVSAARNTGIEVANGDFFAFLDDDDYWYTTKTERQLAVFEETRERVGAVFCHVEKMIDGKTTSIRRPTAIENKHNLDNLDGAKEGTHTPVASKDLQSSRDTTELMLSGETLCSLPSVIVDANIVRKHEIYFDEKLDCWEDLDWYLRLSLYCEFEAVNEPLTVKREGEHKQLTDDFESIRKNAFPRFRQKHRSLAAEYGPNIEQEFVARLALMLSSMAFANHEYSFARQQALRSICHNPRRKIPYLYLLASLGGKFTARPLQALQRAYSS